MLCTLCVCVNLYRLSILSSSLFFEIVNNTVLFHNAIAPCDEIAVRVVLPMHSACFCGILSLLDHASRAGFSAITGSEEGS